MKRFAGLPSSLLSPAALAMAGIFLAALATHAAAAATNWVDSQGGRIRIVSAPPDAKGHIRAAVDIELKPGWTTYWRNPGEAGIPPQLDTKGSRNIASAKLAFPAPVELDEGGVTAIGYDRPVALALTLRQARPGADSVLQARLFIGVCKEICIPVRADFSLDIPAVPKAESSIAAVTVAEAFASLPEPESDRFAVRQVTLAADGQSLTVRARLPDPASAADAPPQLFLAGPPGWSFAPARLQARRGKEATFTVPVTAKPDKTSDGASLVIVLRDGLRSIETTKTLR